MPDDQPSDRAVNRPAWWHGVVLFGVAMLLYLPAMGSGFIFDDDVFLWNNEMIHDAGGLLRFWFSTEPPDYFPLTSTTLWLEWRLWGDHAVGYHVVNVLLHAGSCLLLWRVLLALSIPGAWMAALLFAVHPVNVESVAWITQRKNTLSMVFYLAALLLYLRAEEAPGSPRGRRRYWSSLGVFTLALLAKTSAVVLAPALLLCAWWRRRRIALSDVRRAAPFFLVALALGLITVWYQTFSSIGDAVVREDGVLSRAAIAARAVWFYLGKALLPHDLMFVYPRWEVGATSGVVWLPLGALVGGLALAWWGRRGWGRPVLFALAYYVLALGPVLGFVNIYFMRYSLVSDHWQYMALVAVPAFVAGVLGHLAGRLRMSGVFAGVGIVVATVFAAQSWQQQAIYRDVDALWSDTLERNPQALIAYHNYGGEQALRGNYDEALRLFEAGLQLDAGDVGIRYNLAKTHMRMGKPTLAAEEYRRVVRLLPSYGKAHSDLGQALLSLGRPQEAERHFVRAIELLPDLAEPRGGLAGVRHQQKRFDDAVRLYREALALRSDHPEVHANLANLFVDTGELELALEHYRAALMADPELTGARYNLALTLSELGQFAAALPHYERVLREQPQFLGARYHAGVSLVELGRFDEAGPFLSAVVKAQPEDAAARLALARAQVGRSRHGDAASSFQRALRLAPEDPQVMGRFARFLATCPETSYRDLPRALQLASEAVQLSDEKHPEALRSLARVHAVMGDFDAAVRWQEKVVVFRRDEADRADLSAYRAKRLP